MADLDSHGDAMKGDDIFCAGLDRVEEITEAASVTLGLAGKCESLDFLLVIFRVAPRT